MTRDEIAQAMHDTAGSDWGTEAHFQRFAALVAAAEREECARVCDDLELPEHYEGAWASGWSDGTDDCAAAIRARGET